jgi:hypothetical protein
MKSSNFTSVTRERISYKKSFGVMMKPKDWTLPEWMKPLLSTALGYDVNIPVFEEFCKRAEGSEERNVVTILENLNKAGLLK